MVQRQNRGRIKYIEHIRVSDKIEQVKEFMDISVFIRVRLGNSVIFKIAVFSCFSLSQVNL